MKLVIVESPAKAKTIEKYLGSDYMVLSSYGHMRDLPKSKINIDIENNFTPHYEVPKDKAKVVSELKKAVKKASEVLLATDEDREGEAISWHLAIALGLNIDTTKRITFNEITKDALLHAIKTPKHIDMDLVNAQQARRVLDRIVGYELSPVLWKKVQYGLSAGRVQSVSVRLLVDREREIQAHKASLSYKGSVVCSIKKHNIKGVIDMNTVDVNDINTCLEALNKDTYTIHNIEKKKGKSTAPAPFTTSTLQQTASQRLGMSVSRVMQVAQKLYEQGLITYMRTDSTALSQAFLESAKGYITKTYGSQYSDTKVYSTKSKNAQEAHEAIRPTDAYKPIISTLEPSEQRLYSLIYKRAIGSQMPSAELLKTHIDVIGATTKAVYTLEGQIITFDGYLILDDKSDKKENILPDCAINDTVEIENIEIRETYSKPKPRYTEATLVKKLEELGIGRPSTYAPTIQTILKREYIERSDSDGVRLKIAIYTIQKGDKKAIKTDDYEIQESLKGKLIPTSLGILTTDFLVKHFKDTIDYGFTATVEEAFDAIANGKIIWYEYLKTLYKPFHTLILEADEIDRSSIKQVRHLGYNDKNEEIIVRFARFGAVIETKKTDGTSTYTPLKRGQNIETITLEEALENMKLPRYIGTTDDDKAITASIGRFGPYLQIGTDKLFVSLEKTDDPYTITLERALELYNKKLEKIKNSFIKSFEKDNIEVLNGHFGPYLKHKKGNTKIPKTLITELGSIDNITLEQAKMLIEESSKKPKRVFKKKG